MDLTEFPSLQEQRAIVKHFDTDRPCDEPEGIEHGEDNWDLEDMVIAKEMTTSCCRGKF